MLAGDGESVPVGVGEATGDVAFDPRAPEASAAAAAGIAEVLLTGDSSGEVAAVVEAAVAAAGEVPAGEVVPGGLVIPGELLVPGDRTVPGNGLAGDKEEATEPGADAGDAELAGDVLPGDCAVPDAAVAVGEAPEAEDEGGFPGAPGAEAVLEEEDDGLKPAAVEEEPGASTPAWEHQNEADMQMALS